MHCMSSSTIKGITLPSDSFLDSVQPFPKSPASDGRTVSFTADNTEEIPKREQNDRHRTYCWDEIMQVHNPLLAISNSKALKNLNKFSNSFGF